jgi:hypothetical protein
MTDNNREMIWFGTSGRLQKQTTPALFSPGEVLPSLFPDNSAMIYAMGQKIDFSVVKVSCTWSKTISITNLMIADLRAMNEEVNQTKLQHAIQTLSKQWDQREGKIVYYSNYPVQLCPHMWRPSLGSLVRLSCENQAEMKLPLVDQESIPRGTTH